MNNTQRLNIEQLILSSFINQNRTVILDELEFKDMIIPFELFKASMTTKLTAKAIYNLQKEKKPIDDLNIICYIEKHTKLNEFEFLEISSCLWCTFDTMILYLNQLKEIDKEESKMKILRDMM